MLRRYLAWILQQDANHGLYAYDGVVMIELRTAQHVWPILILFSQKAWPRRGADFGRMLHLTILLSLYQTISVTRATQCLVLQFVSSSVRRSSRWDQVQPSYGRRHPRFCVGAQNAWARFQIVTIDHLWKVCLISLTEINELTNWRTDELAN
jgi:hypothetical protein